MQIQENVDLSSYMTVRIGGKAKKLFFPESIEELCTLQKDLPSFLIISGGSNILMDDTKQYNNVIHMKKVDTSMRLLDDGCFYCGASVRIQSFIKYAQSEGYGGIEYLYSLPAMMGGIIVMNAGRGKQSGCSISDTVEEVYAVKRGERITLRKDECNFSYRKSLFQNEDMIVVGVKLRLTSMSRENIQKGIEERIELCKNTQDHSGNTFGSVFCESDTRIMKLCQKLAGKKGIRWSPKRLNWMINDGTGTFFQANRSIKMCERLHKFLRKRVELEVRIWK